MKQLCPVLWRITALLLAGMILAPASSAQAQDVLDEWATIKVPPPPAIKPVTLDPKTTALLSMDFNRANCTPDKRARCFAALPKVQKLLAEARANGMVVIHTYGPNMEKADIVKAVAPVGDEPAFSAGGDKLAGDEVERILKDRGIATLLLAGTSANGAVLFTAIGGSQGGFKIVVPVDAIPADTAYQEQFTIWEIANGPGLREHSTLTRSDLLKF